MPRGALDGIRVIDLSDSAAGAWCCRMFADLGADVVMVEAPTGHPLRHQGPFDASGESIPATYFLANRRSLILGLDDVADATIARELGRRADVVVSSAGPAVLAQRELRFEDFAQQSLVMVHITPWGMTGELANAPGNDLAVAARSGWASINGDAAREPLKPSGWQASYCTGVAAFTAAVAALHARDALGTGGQEVDIAAVEVMGVAFAPAFLRAQYTGHAPGRRREADLLAGPVPVADGHFALTISRAHFWRDAMNVLGLHDLAEDRRWDAGWYRQAHKDEYVGRVQQRMREWPKWRLFEELALRRVVAGPVVAMEELVGSEHLAARNSWQRPADDPDAPLQPGPPFRMSGTPATLRRRAPRPGEHADEIRAGVEP